MSFLRSFHPKVKWAAFASALWVIASAILNQAGVHLSPEILTGVGGLLALVGGYAAPAS